MKYDYLIIGSGLFGATFAHFAHKQGKKCLVIDKRPQLGGNLYCEEKEGINVHKYGAHIFHTQSKRVWEFVNSLVEFNRYTNSPVANYQGQLYNLPFNMNTFYQMWGTKTPEEASAKIEEQRQEALKKMNEEGIKEPRNLEEQALLLIGKDIYEKLIKGYTEKQWGRKCTDLPAFIIKRLPVRFVFDNNYFNDKYQGIPIDGYTKIIEKMLGIDEYGNKIIESDDIKGIIDLRLGYDYFENKEELDKISDKIIFTGPIDQYYNYKFGHLEYRTVRFETEELEVNNYQGNAVVNYTEKDIPYTRIIEHKHFEIGNQLGIPETFLKNLQKSGMKKKKHIILLIIKLIMNFMRNIRNFQNKMIRLYLEVDFGEYKYYDMDKVIERALEVCKKILD